MKTSCNKNFFWHKRHLRHPVKKRQIINYSLSLDQQKKNDIDNIICNKNYSNKQHPGHKMQTRAEINLLMVVGTIKKNCCNQRVNKKCLRIEKQPVKGTTIITFIQIHCTVLYSRHTQKSVPAAVKNIFKCNH